LTGGGGLTAPAGPQWEDGMSLLEMLLDGETEYWMTMEARRRFRAENPDSECPWDTAHAKWRLPENVAAREKYERGVYDDLWREIIETTERPDWAQPTPPA
jgi:hypothetical protein